MRYLFGGGLGDFAANRSGGSWQNVGATEATAWTDETDGTQHVDLLLGGEPVTALPIRASGRVPAFSGPDGVADLWLQIGNDRDRYHLTTAAPSELTSPNGTRYRLTVTDDGAVIAVTIDPQEHS